MWLIHSTVTSDVSALERERERERERRERERERGERERERERERYNSHIKYIHTYYNYITRSRKQNSLLGKVETEVTKILGSIRSQTSLQTGL